jgi:hypothetical protein
MAKAEHVKRALDLFGDELGRKENVVGLGRVPTGEGKPGEWCLAVYVSKKVPEDQLAGKDLVPKTLEVPGKTESHEVTTKVIEQGVVGLESL